ncbi:hypothetical protein TIFTF001_021832 [Ficus carica]|uniref:Ubiquitin-like protease family profile domain-containing protein n=1 Tax=Ficus carica TaxID=3494 RepID=A0AA88AT03_FICCA|nr:hypothetical protein TIFTF001_021832 [Ficus carica]
MGVNDAEELISSLEAKLSKAEEGQYVRLVPDSQISRAKINTFVNITETLKKLRGWLSPRQYESLKTQPCIQQFMHLDTLGWSGQVFHNIVMRLTTHSAMGDALWFKLGEDLVRFSINEFCLITGLNCVGSTHLPVVESRLMSKYFPDVRGVTREYLELQMSNSKFDNDDDAVKLSLLYIVFSIPLSNASSVKIDPKYFALADNLDAFNEFPWGVLSWEATRTAICSTVENRISSKRGPKKNIDKSRYSVAGFPQALLVWAYETSPVIASKFTTNYEHALPRMMSWTTADNVRFDDVLAAFATVGESKCVDLTPTEEELKNPCVARLFLNLPQAQPQLPPSKSSFLRPSTDTNSEWREFQKEIRTEIASLKKEQKHSNKLLRRVLKMLSANSNVKGQGQPHTAHEDAENENNKVNIAVEEVNEGEANAKSEPSVEETMEEAMPDLEKGVIEEDDGKEIIPDQDPSILDEPSNEDSIGALIPKKKRARLSSLRQRPSGRTTDIGSPSKAPTNLIYALPPCLADQPPEQTLEEFREWIKAGVLKRSPPSKRPPRYVAKHDTLSEPHDLGLMLVEKKSWYYELATSPVWLWDEHIDVAFYYLRKKSRQFTELKQRMVTTVDTFFTSKIRSLWRIHQRSPANFDWGSCESILKIMTGVKVQSGSSWFDVNTLLIPVHLDDLKHWVLVKLELTSWTIEVYDSLQHEGRHNASVREGVECLAVFIPMLAERINLFDVKKRDPPGIHPIPVTIMKDIPKQANGGDCGMFTIKYAECLLEGRDVRYWVIAERMQLFREWLACFFWLHAKRKIEQTYKSDDDVNMDIG